MKNHRLVDMIGQTIGFWEVLCRDTNSKDSSVRWMCLCKKCDKQYSIRGTELRNGTTSQCKQCYRMSSWKGDGECSGSIISQLKYGAYQRNYQFLVSPEFLNNLYKNQNGKCALSGLDINFSIRNKKYDCKAQTASLDRINSLGDYTEDNIRWLHKNVNLMRWNLSDDIFLYFVNHIANLENKNGNHDISYKQDRHKNWRGYGEISGRYFSITKRSALARKIDFNITIEDMWELFLKQDRRCHLTNIELHFPEKSENLINQTASLDRINPNGGYQIQNIQWVHKTINLMKREFDQNYFIEICKIIDDYQKGKQ